MRKKRRLLLLVICLVLSSLPLGAYGLISLNTANQDVLMLQQRLIDLHYFAFKPTGNYGGMTRNAVINFQSVHALSTDGTVGTETFEKIFSSDAYRAPINASIPIGPNLPSGQAPETFGSIEADWFTDVDPQMQLNASFNLTDIITGKSYNVVRVGGINHARVEPTTEEDYEIFMETFGGEYNWSKRPVVITVGTVRHAASIQGFPDGEDIVSGNGMEGNCALYFSGSLSDISGLPDAEHRSTILKASGESYWS